MSRFVRSPSAGRGALCAAALLIALAGVGRARAQTKISAGGVSGGTAVPDSLLNWRYKFQPMMSATSRSDVSSVSLGSKFTNSIIGINGLLFQSTISVDRRNYRLQDKFDSNRSLINTVLKPLAPGLNLTISQTNKRTLSRVVLPTGGFLDFRIDNTILTTGAAYASPVSRPFAFDAHTNLTGSSTDLTYKRDSDQSIQGFGGARYAAAGGRLRVAARAGRSKTNEHSSSVYREFPFLGSSDDSLLARVDVEPLDSLNVSFDYVDYNYARTFADQQRGSQGSQQQGAENLFREHETRETRTMGFKADLKPTGRFGVNMEARHADNLDDFAVTKTRFTHSVSDALNGGINYSTTFGTVVGVKLAHEQYTRDFGPLSVSSRDDVNKRASVSITQNLSKTFSLAVVASQTLSQAFYKNKTENPRDNDQLDSSLNLNVYSQPLPKISAQLLMSVATTKFVNIDASQSQNNRVKQTYNFSPVFTYTMNSRTSIQQSYGLAIEFTDYDYTKDQNFLDRNLTFSNTIIHQATDHIKVQFGYSLRLHDQGSYLPDATGERFLTVATKDREDRTKITFDYKINEHLDLVGEHDYSRRSNRTVSSGDERVTTDGGLTGGVKGNYKFGNNRSLVLGFQRAERFSPFNTEKQNHFWIANLAFNYAF